MRINQAKRIFMNEADSSPGNGAPVSPPPPAQPPASTAASAPTPAYVTADQLNEKFEAFQNGFFASARKAGLLKTNEPAPAPTPSPAPQASTTAPNPMALIALRDAFDDATSDLKLDKGQRQLLREHVMTKQPDVSAVDQIVSDFVKRAGWSSSGVQGASAAATPPVTPIVTPQPSPAPISDKGSPAPGNGSNWNREFADNPLNMSAAAIAQMNAELGKEVAQRKRVEAALSRGVNLKVTPR